MNYSDFIKENEEPARDPKETHCFPIDAFEYQHECLHLYKYLVDRMYMFTWDADWIGERDPETKEPTKEAKNLMSEFLYLQVEDYIMSLPWDEDKKLPNFTTKKAIKEYFRLWVPDKLDEETVQQAITIQKNEPRHHKTPTPEEAIEWFKDPVYRE